MKQISFSWEEGHLLDFWTVVHFLSGAVIGFFGEISLLSFKQVLIIGSILLVLWEVFEHVRGIRETIMNRIIDVIIAVIGMLLFFMISFVYRDLTVTLGVGLTVLTIFLSYRGWRAYLIRVGKQPPHDVKEAYRTAKEDIRVKKKDMV
ncbi:hypothetical protein KTR10_01800 [Candidatus Kaiserbacteria bacterium]|nr:hypothetical protein [Candidatus Kaiserbacteria bacterium]